MTELAHPPTPNSLGYNSSREAIPFKTIAHTVGATEIEPLALAVFHTELTDQSLTIEFADGTETTIPNVPPAFEIKGLIRKVTAATDATTVYLWV